MKTCSICHKKLPFEECIKSKRADGRPVFRCKPCSDEAARHIVDIKVCRYCGSSRPTYDFGPRKGGRNGLKSYCKQCEATRRRDYRATMSCRGTKTDKQNAYREYRAAIKSGELQRGPCSVCGTTVNVHGHHPDYSKPLDVVWLCSKHHCEEHVRRRVEVDKRYQA